MCGSSSFLSWIELALCYLAGEIATEQQIDYYHTTCHGHYHPWIIPFVAHVTKKKKQGNTQCSSYPRQDRQSWVFRTFPPSTLATPIAMIDRCGSLRLSGPLLLAPSVFAVCSLLLLFLLFFFLATLVLSVCASRHPKATLAVLHATVLAREIVSNAFAHLLMTALGEVAGAGAERWLDGCVCSHPVGEGVFAVLNDTIAIELEAITSIGGCGATYALLASYPSYASRVSPGVTGVSSTSSKRCFPKPAMMASFSLCSLIASNW